MAEFYSTQASSQVPYTPTKGGINVSSSEVAPDYSPGAAPVYEARNTNSLATQDYMAKIASVSADYANTSRQNLHPKLPVGSIVYDIRHHLTCHKNFNYNIEELIRQFLGMKEELDVVRVELGKTQRELLKERDEKETVIKEKRVLEATLEETRQDLRQVRDELLQSEERLRLAIIQLTEAARKLEQTRADLRKMTRERDEYAQKYADSERAVEFFKARADELQKALAFANAGENAANDRNTRLTELLYQIERSKAMIERSKDQAEARTRELGILVQQLQDKINKGIENSDEVVKLRLLIVHLNETIEDEQKKRDALNNEVTKQQDEVRRLNLEVGYLQRNVDSMKGNHATIAIVARKGRKLAEDRKETDLRNRFRKIIRLAEPKIKLASLPIMSESAPNVGLITSSSRSVQAYSVSQLVQSEEQLDDYEYDSDEEEERQIETAQVDIDQSGPSAEGSSAEAGKAVEETEKPAETASKPVEEAEEQIAGAEANAQS